MFYEWWFLWRRRCAKISRTLFSCIDRVCIVCNCCFCCKVVEVDGEVVNLIVLCYDVMVLVRVVGGMMRFLFSLLFSIRLSASCSVAAVVLLLRFKL